MIKIFTTNSNEKIEFSKEELESLLKEAYDEAYEEGYKQGIKLGKICDTPTITNPYNPLTPYYGTTTPLPNIPTTTIKTTNKVDKDDFIFVGEYCNDIH